MRKILLVLVLISGANAFAGEAVLTAANGPVDIKGADGVVKASKMGDKIKSEQTVHTGAHATAVILYPDETRVKLKENTEVKVHFSDVAQEKTGADLIVGAIFSAVSKRKEPHFFVKTPTAVAGVRGTEFFTSYDQRDKVDNVWLCVHEGEVEVRPVDKRPPVIVKEGLGIIVNGSKKIADPKPYEWTKKLNWNMNPEAGEIEDKSSLESEYKDLLKNKYD